MMVVVVTTWEKAGLLPLSPVGHRILITTPELIMVQDLILSFANLFFTTNCGKFLKKKFLKRWEYQTTWCASWEICMQVKKQQLELDMEQQTGSK